MAFHLIQAFVQFQFHVKYQQLAIVEVFEQVKCCKSITKYAQRIANERKKKKRGAFYSFSIYMNLVELFRPLG